jgi:hypothetical protein
MHLLAKLRRATLALKVTNAGSVIVEEEIGTIVATRVVLVVEAGVRRACVRSSTRR